MKVILFASSYHQRFNKENRPKIPSCAHMPFGAGPRQCIGMRLAIMNAKIVLIEILRKYKFVLAPETKVNLTCIIFSYHM